jgi:hypothetical protein
MSVPEGGGGGAAGSQAAPKRKRGRPTRLEALRREGLLEYAQAHPPPEPGTTLALPDSLSGSHLAEASTGHQLQVPEFVRPTLAIVPLGQALPPLPSHPLAEYVVQMARHAAELPESELDDDTCNFADEYWSPASNIWHSTSMLAQTYSSGLPGSFIRNTERRLSAAAEMVGRSTGVELQTTLASLHPRVSLIAFVEHARYDEATFVLGVRQSPEPELATTGPGEEPNLHLAHLLGQSSVKEDVPAKLFQTDSQWGALFSEDPQDGSPKRFVMLTSETVVSPQVLQQTTAPVIAQALLCSSVIRPPALQDFRWCMRLVTSDRYAAQLLAERQLLLLRPSWHKLHIACEVHMNVASQSKALQLVAPGVSGMIRLALSLKLGGWMRVFRRCICQEVAASLEVLHGTSTDAASTFRRRAVQMFVGVGSRKRRIVQAILSMLPNGDWQLEDRVQVYRPPDCSLDRPSLVKLVSKALCMSLAAGSFAVFNRARWTSNDIAISQIGLLQACHGLLARCYRRWLLAVGHKGMVPSTLGAPSSSTELGRVELANAEEEQMLALGDRHPDDDGEDVGMAEGPLGHDPPGAPFDRPVPATEGIDMAAENEKTRGMAKAWLLGPTAMRDVVLARCCMEPSMCALRRQLHIGSERWEKEQQRKGLPSGHATQREYRILLAARGELDAVFQEHLSILFFHRPPSGRCYPQHRRMRKLCVSPSGCALALEQNTSA